MRVLIHWTYFFTSLTVCETAVTTVPATMRYPPIVTRIAGIAIGADIKTAPAAAKPNPIFLSLR